MGLYLELHSESTQQPDPPAYSGDVLWIIFAKVQVPFWAQGSAQLENSINSMTLQVALTRVAAENRSAAWHVLNLPGLLIRFFLHLLSELGLEIWLALLSESCPGTPGAIVQTLPLSCPSYVTLNESFGFSESHFLIFGMSPNLCHPTFPIVVNDPLFI